MLKNLRIRGAALTAFAVGAMAGVSMAPTVSTPAGMVRTVAEAGGPAANEGRSLPTQGPMSPEQKAARLDWLRRRSTAGYRRPGPGWSYAHVKRCARKARNVARNRRAQRGSR